MEVKSAAIVDPMVLGAEPLSGFQFERIGYFCVDYDSKPDKVINHCMVMPGLCDTVATCTLLLSYMKYIPQPHSQCMDYACVVFKTMPAVNSGVPHADCVQQNCDPERRLWQKLSKCDCIVIIQYRDFH